MSQQVEIVSGETYIVVRGSRGQYGWKLSGFKTVKNKPAVDSDEIAIKVKLSLPVALFEKPTLAANIAVEGDVPVLELDAETVEAVQNVIRSTTGLDVELRVVDPD